MPALLKTEYATAADEIRALAEQHGITAEKSDFDYVSDTFANLAGDTPVKDEVHQLCLNLVRAKVIDDKYALDLIIRHIAA